MILLAQVLQNKKPGSMQLQRSRSLIEILHIDSSWQYARVDIEWLSTVIWDKPSYSKTNICKNTIK